VSATDFNAKQGEMLMKRSKTDVLYDANGEAGSFLTKHPLLCLTGNIFEETEAGLHNVSGRVTKLLRFVGGVIEQQYDGSDQGEEKAETGRNEKQARRANRNETEGDREREWQLRKLRHINVELYHQIGDLFRIKLQVLDVIERIKMAQLERSKEERLRASFRLVRGEDDKSAESEQLNDQGGAPGEPSTANPTDWVPDSD
jgi:hypothetical protein